MKDIRYALKRLFKPQSVAVIGASGSSKKLGFHVMKSLVSGGFRGRIVPINPKSKEILGISTFPSLNSCDEDIDLAIVVLPSSIVEEILRQCVKKGIKAVVLISAGFKEMDDPVGGILQDRLSEFADSHGMSIIGPNTFGMINLHHQLNASFTPQFSQLKKGRVSLLSQSGGMSHLLGFLAMSENVGMSKIIGLGNRLNLDFPEMISYLEEDPFTEIIMLYLEGIERGRELLETFSKIDSPKPIIAYKAGIGIHKDRASLSHTGTVAGRKEIYEGAFMQAGILSVQSAHELLDTAKALSICPIPLGPRVAILSGQAGPGICCADVCSKDGLEIVQFSKESQKVIDKILPPMTHRSNPVDMGPLWYNSEAMADIVEAVIRDRDVDSVIILMMFASANLDIVDVLLDRLNNIKINKPVITCFNAPQYLWKEAIHNGEENRVIANFPTPERAARAMVNLFRYSMLKRGWQDGY